MNALVAIRRFFKTIWINTDFIVKWIQVLALIVAAYWAYTRFLTGEKPNLEPRVELATGLKDELPGPIPDSCYVYFNFSLKNSGIVSFDIQGADIKAWRSTLSALSAEDDSYIDPLRFENGVQIVNMHDRDLLNMHFAPGESAERNFAWVFSVKSAAVYFFTVDLDARSDDGTRKHIHTQSWSQTICQNSTPSVSTAHRRH